jgi:lipid-A-disaccharide synthase
LGFVASAAFTMRFLIQWIASEKEGRSIIPRSFWQLSLVANCLMVLHSIFQLQYHVGFIQIVNGVIAWRNLNLISDLKKRFLLKNVLILLAILLLSFTGLFLFLDYAIFEHSASWFRIPTYFSSEAKVSAFWHVIGVLGMLFFSSRFWVQWWDTERRSESIVRPSFWWLSLIGAFLSAIYFVRIYDVVNFLGPCVGLIPYIRNLMLLKPRRI